MCLGADRVKKARVQTLRVEFENFSMKDTEKIDDFTMKLNGIVTNIRTLGETIVESVVVKKLLRSMPSEFLQITLAIVQFGDLENMSVEEAVGSLKAHEEPLKGQQSDNTGQLLLTDEEWTRRESTDRQLLFTKDEWIKMSKNGGTEVSQTSKIRSTGGGGSRGNRGGTGQDSFEGLQLQCFWTLRL